MKLSIFNAALAAGWLLLTLGALMLNLWLGLMVAGLAMIGLTIFVAVRYGVYQLDRAVKALGAPPSEAEGDDFAGRKGNSVRVASFGGR